METDLSLEEKSNRWDWRGLLLVLAALLIYFIGPLSNYLVVNNTSSLEVDVADLVANIGSDRDCGTDPRRAIFLLEPIDLNLADGAVLDTLKGVGPELAARIVEYRDQRGGFDKVSDITEVSGIGPKKLAGFIDDVTVTDCSKPL